MPKRTARYDERAPRSRGVLVFDGPAGRRRRGSQVNASCLTSNGFAISFVARSRFHASVARAIAVPASLHQPEQRRHTPHGGERDFGSERRGVIVAATCGAPARALALAAAASFQSPPRLREESINSLPASAHTPSSAPTECTEPTLHADCAISGQNVVDATDAIAPGRELPEATEVDHETAFTSGALGTSGAVRGA